MRLCWNMKLGNWFDCVQIQRLRTPDLGNIPRTCMLAVEANSFGMFCFQYLMQNRHNVYLIISEICAFSFTICGSIRYVTVIEYWSFLTKIVIYIPKEVQPIRRDAQTSRNATATSSSFVTPSATVPGTITSIASFSTSFCPLPTTIITEYCRVTVGTVQLHFWPTSDPSAVYPSTVVIPEYNYTM